MGNTWFNMVNLKGRTDSKNIKNVAIGFLSNIWREDVVILSVPDHESHILTIIGGVQFGSCRGVTRHVAKRWQRESIHHNDSTECEVKFGNLHVTG